MSAKLDPNKNSKGPYFYILHIKVCGQVCESLNTSSTTPTYCQLYILDSKEATSQRANDEENSKCQKEVKI